jgi:hypothetical protein
LTFSSDIPTDGSLFNCSDLLNITGSDLSDEDLANLQCKILDLKTLPAPSQGNVSNMTSNATENTSMTAGNASVMSINASMMTSNVSAENAT